MEKTDCIVIGAGVVGLAVARTFALAGHEVIILEAENAFGSHTSSRNSGCIHAGINYPLGSLKAQLAKRGKELLYQYCPEHGVSHKMIGKIIAVGNRASTVQIITDRNFRISVRLGERWNLGIFMPTHGKFGIVEGIPKSQKVSPGDLIITSGISEIYPADLPVAEVLEVYVDQERPFLQIIAEISADIYNSDYIFIVQ